MRKSSKKIAYTIASAFGLWLVSSRNIYATLAIQNPVGISSLEELITVLSNFIRPVIIVVLIMVLIYGGWVRMTAADNADKVASSSKIIVSALVGFAIIVLAPVIVEFVGALIGVRGGVITLGG